MKSIATFLVVLTLWYAPLARSDDQTTKNFKITPQITLRVPMGWSEIGNSTITRLENVIKGMGGTLDLHAGKFFQEAGKPPFSDPYIAIQLHSTGRFAVKDSAELVGEIKKGMGLVDTRALEKSTANIVRDTTFSGVHYDKENGTIVFRFRANGPDNIELSAKSVLYFVEDGVVQLTCYASSSTFNLYEGTCDQIASDLDFAEGYEYNPIGASKTVALFSNLPFYVKTPLILLALGVFLRILSSINFSGRALRNRGKAGSKVPFSSKRVPVSAPPIPPALEAEQYRAPPLTTTSPLFGELRKIVSPLGGVKTATLFARTSQDLKEELVLIIEITESLSLRDQQTTLNTIRQQLPSGKIAQIARTAPPENQRAGSGLTILSRKTPPSLEKKEKKKKGSDEIEPLTLMLDN